MTNSPFLQAYATVNTILVGTPAQSHISACLGRYIATNNLGDSIPYGHLWDHSHLADPNHVLRAFLIKATDLGNTQNELFREGDAAFIESSVKSYLKQIQDQSTDCGEDMKATLYEINPATDIREWLGLSARQGILDEVRYQLRPNRKSLEALHKRAKKEEALAQQDLRALTPIVKLMMRENRLSLEGFQDSVTCHARTTTWGEILHDTGTILDYSYVA